MFQNIRWIKLIGIFLVLGSLYIPAIILAEMTSNLINRSQFTIQISPFWLTGDSRINVMDVGAKGDGVTDDTAAIQKAVTRANQGTIYFPKGTYLVTSPVTIERSGLFLVGDQAKILFKPVLKQPNSLYQIREGKTGMSGLPNSAFLIKGNLENSGWELAETAPAESRIIKTIKQVDLNQGDIIILSSKSYGKKIGRQKAHLLFSREINFISEVAGVLDNQITLKDALPTMMARENSPKLFKITPVRNVVIRGFQFEIASNSSDLDISAISLVYAVNTLIEKVTINNTSEAGIHLIHCYLCKIADNSINNSIRFDSGHGFGISMNRSHFCLIQNNTLANHRHGILLDHGNSNCLVEGNCVGNCKTIASIDIHGEYNSWNVIRGNNIYDGKTGIAVGGGGDVHYNDGPMNCIVDNTISKCNVGIELKNETESIILGKNDFKVVKENIRLTNIKENQIIKL